MSFPIGYESADLLDKANTLAAKYGFTIDNDVLPRLQLSKDKLSLHIDGFLPLFADFNGAHAQRRHHAGKKQGLISACKPKKGMRIIDVTAGWGRDAALLASFGADVLMIERNPMMAALLEDALARRQPFTSDGDLSLVYHDAKAYLQALNESDYPAVIYIDPMHPERQKSALVKKDMQALQAIIGSDEDAKALMETAVHRMRQNMVVKWPQRLAPLLPPTRSVQGKTVRFDIYTRVI